MIRWFFLLLSLTSVIHCLQEQVENKSKDVQSKPLVQRSLDQETAQQQENNIDSKSEKSHVESQKEQQPKLKQESVTDEVSPQPQVSARQQHILQQQYAPVAFIEPQYQYPGFGYFQGKQPVARGQPQLVVYGPGQGQPILINPGSPPGNFLVPQQPQPGPNFVLRDQGAVFLAGYPKPAHIPPIEKDAEEIPTNPAKIPPLPTTSNGKPEKLETLNEERKETPESTSSEEDGLADGDKKQAFPKSTNLQPGQRFFILNGEPLFQNYAFQNNLGLPNFDSKYQQPYVNYQQPYLLPSKQALDQQYSTYPFGALVLRNDIAKDTQGYFNNPIQQQSLIEQNNVKTDAKSPEQEQKLSEQQISQNGNPSQPQENFHFPNIYNLQGAPYDFLAQIPQSQHSQIQTQDQKAPIGEQTNAPDEHQIQSQVSQFLSPEQNLGIETRTFPQGNFFRSSLPFTIDGGDQGFDEFGQFRFSAPSGPYYPTNGEDVENDSIVVNANLDEENSESSNDKVDNGDIQSIKSSDPSTAQASPGAVALAGPGGVAGAAPKATALAGKGGLAVSSPQATAVAGTQRDKDAKKPTDKATTK